MSVPVPAGGGERRRLTMLLSHTLHDLEKEIAGHSRKLEIVGRFHAKSGSAASRYATLRLRALRDEAIGDLWAVHAVARHSHDGRIAPPKGLSKLGLIAFARKAARALPARAEGGRAHERAYSKAPPITSGVRVIV